MSEEKETKFNLRYTVEAEVAPDTWIALNNGYPFNKESFNSYYIRSSEDEIVHVDFKLYASAKITKESLK